MLRSAATDAVYSVSRRRDWRLGRWVAKRALSAAARADVSRIEIFAVAPDAAPGAAGLVADRGQFTAGTEPAAGAPMRLV